MASKKTKEKIGFKDLVTFAKAGWTPEETNAILDRLEAMGDPLDNNSDDSDEGDEDETDDDADDSDDDNSDDDDTDDNNSDDDHKKDDDEDDDEDSDDVQKNLDKMKTLGLEVENKRLKKELEKLKAKNRSKDVSGKSTDNKSAQDKFTDALQSCF